MPKKIIDGEQYEVVENYDLGTNVFKGGGGGGAELVEVTQPSLGVTQIEKTYKELWDMCKSGNVPIFYEEYEDEINNNIQYIYYYLFTITDPDRSAELKLTIGYIYPNIGSEASVDAFVLTAVSEDSKPVTGGLE